MSKGNVRLIISDPRFSLEFQEFVVQHLTLLVKMQTEMLQQLTEMNRQMSETVAIASGARDDLRIPQWPAAIRSRTLVKKTKGGNMTEDDTNNLDGQSTNEPPFEEFVRRQFESLFAEIAGLRVEMVERFLQLSRQIKHLDQKVDVFVQEHTFLKDELRELRAAQRPKS